ncbi:hypothetical protein JCM12296A_20960 [Desulfosarcina cetonica]
MVYYYFAEVIEKFPRDKIRYLFTMTSWLKEEERTQDPPTRQAISRNFDKIGQYIWDSFIVDLHPSFKEEDVFDDLLDLIYEKITAISSYIEFYNSLNDFPLYVNSENITGSMFFYLLSSRSKAIRGYKKDKFYLEFSRAFFICAAIDTNKTKLSSIYDVHVLDYPYPKIRKIKNFNQIKSNFGWYRTNLEFQKIDAEWQKSNTIRRKIMGFSKGLLLSFLKEKPM